MVESGELEMGAGRNLRHAHPHVLRAANARRQSFSRAALEQAAKSDPVMGKPRAARRAVTFQSPQQSPDHSGPNSQTRRDSAKPRRGE